MKCGPYSHLPFWARNLRSRERLGVASLPQTSNLLLFLTCPFSPVFVTVRSLPQLSWDTLAYKEYGRSSSKAHFSPHLGHTHLCACTGISFQVTSLGNLLWVCQLFFEIQEKSIKGRFFSEVPENSPIQNKSPEVSCLSGPLLTAITTISFSKPIMGLAYL